VRGNPVTWQRDERGEAQALNHGEVWKLRFGDPLERSEPVRVVGIDALVLAAEPLPKGEAR